MEYTCSKIGLKLADKYPDGSSEESSDDESSDEDSSDEESSDEESSDEESSDEESSDEESSDEESSDEESSDEESSDEESSDEESSDEESSDEESRESVQKIETKSLNSRRCGLCKEIGHYRNNCPKIMHLPMKQTSTWNANHKQYTMARYKCPCGKQEMNKGNLDRHQINHNCLKRFIQ